MASRIILASLLMLCLFAISLQGRTAMANAASDRQSAQMRGERAKSQIYEIKRRRRGPKIQLPTGPAYIYYDYPYYYARGHYPTHIGGYVYYRPYSSSAFSRANGRCSATLARCVAGLRNQGRAYARRLRAQ